MPWCQVQIRQMADLIYYWKNNFPPILPVLGLIISILHKIKQRDFIRIPDIHKVAQPILLKILNLNKYNDINLINAAY